MKDFFELKEKNGEDIEKWAFYSILYKEAVQRLRQGKFTMKVGRNDTKLQGQELIADKIDDWVRSEFLKRFNRDHINYDKVWHDATLGLIYHE